MGTGNVLVPVDDRAGDDPAPVGQQEHDEVGDLVDLTELAQRKSFGRIGEPAVVGFVELSLDLVLALGLGPTDVESVDSNLVPTVREGGVAGQAGEAGLGGHVRRQVRLTPVRGHGDDVDNRARLASLGHVPHGRLHGEERCTKVDGDVLLEHFGARVEQSAARRQPRRVDEAVHPAEAFHRPFHRPGGLTGLGEIGRQADVFWSGDPVRPFLLVKRGLVEPYISPNAAALPRGLRAADGTWTGFAARARVFLVNKARVSPGEAPRSMRDLSNPRWRGRAAIANPLYGTTTMHVAALFAAWGDTATKDFLEDLKANAVRIASSNGEVKRLVVAGEVAFGLTDTDDAHEALKSGASVEVVYPDQDGIGTLVMPTSVVLMRGRPHDEAGRKLVDYLLTAEVERKMAEVAAHMPLRTGVPTSPTVQPVSKVRAMSVDYARIGAEMERIQPWLRQWAGL